MNSKSTILIVDDVESNIDILVEILSKIYDIVVLTSAENIINLTENESIDLILLDIMMPNIDGYQACKMLKSNSKTAEIPIIFLTAKLDEDSIEMAYDIGGVDYISKPFKPKELLARVKNHLELREYQLYLSQRVNEEIEKNRIQEVVLYQKSKQSALGELLMHIAHQWKQPLAEISAIQTFFEAKVRLNQSNKAFILENIGKTNDILEFMSTTLLTFQDFYKPSIDMEYFDIKDLIEHTIKILSATLKFYRIELTLNLQNHLSFYGVKNEVSQVILNILNNSKNILIQRDIKNGKIKVILLKNTKHLSIVIEDNGGGIKSDFLENLFKPFISENSSGVGLYISKSIIDRYNGEIKAENINDGARFTINLPII